MERFLLLISVALLWSPTFMLIKIALREVPPLWLTWLRVAGGMAMLLIFWPQALRGSKGLLFQHWRVIVPSALFTIALPFSLCSLGEYYVASSLAGIIEGGVPAFTLGLGMFLLPRKHGAPLCPPNYGWAMALGFLGMVVISLPAVLEREWGGSRGLGILLAMALAFAWGFIYYERYLRELPLASLLLLQLGFASLMLLPLAWWGEPEFSPLTITAKAAGALGIVAFGGTSIGSLLFYRLMQTYGAQFASLVTYLCLVFAVFWGVGFLHEELGPHTYGGAGLIIASMVCASLAPRRLSSELRELLSKHQQIAGDNFEQEDNN